MKTIGEQEYIMKASMKKINEKKKKAMDKSMNKEVSRNFLCFVVFNLVKQIHLLIFVKNMPHFQSITRRPPNKELDSTILVENIKIVNKYKSTKQAKFQ